jgi:CSLREA domain-containing protein
VKYKFVLTCVFVSLCLLIVSIRAEPLQATTTIVVNGTDDMVAEDGQCTLHEAITAANTDTASGAIGGECVAGSGDDTIDLTGISGTIHLISPLPDIISNIIFNGPGASSLTVRRDTGGNCRVFTVGGGVNATISGLTMSNGST